MRILVLCTGNSCRSQMAEGYLRHYLPATTEVYSAGIEAHGVNLRAIAVMQEDGISIRHHTSDTLEVYAQMHFDRVITVCDHAQEVCPFIPAHRMDHHSFPDPARAVGSDTEIMQAFRDTRDAIKAYCAAFANEVT